MKKVTMKLSEVMEKEQILNRFINGHTEIVGMGDQARQVQVPPPNIKGVNPKVRYRIGVNHDHLVPRIKRFEEHRKKMIQEYGIVLAVRAEKMSLFLGKLFDSDDAIPASARILSDRYKKLGEKNGLSSDNIDDLKAEAPELIEKIDDWFKENPAGTEKEIVPSKNFTAFSNALNAILDEEETITDIRMIPLSMVQDIAQDPEKDPKGELGTLISQTTFMWEEDEPVSKPKLEVIDGKKGEKPVE